MRAAEEYRAELAAAHDLGEVTRLARKAAREVTGAQGATFVLREEDSCFYADEDAIAPLWKGQRFPITSCISGWAMLNHQTAVIPDIEQDDRIPLQAYRTTFVRSLAMVPVGEPVSVAAVGAYWSVSRRPLKARVAELERLAALIAEAVDRVGLENAPWAPTFRR
ncbi:GAF domain-containing protein [Kribbella amoyensis]|uniref:GAF domain-containing protein n=1 Tax=Kribbella amoyensis TaxID=996641 RepID=A0A561BSW7_9ACTN|nr:GAF domain-containing protein [Kribbella amoyensis]TWD81974.1 GAF domain-containing protein [Kribbella amoyensis]